jgi:mono/diheme cytochrome c family protein
VKKQRALAAVIATLAFGANAVSPAGDASRGKTLFMKNMCYTCHGTAGQGGDRGSGPRIAYDVWPWEGFAQQVRHPRESMPRYDVRYVSDAELADIYAYISSIKPGPKAMDIPALNE